MYHKKHCDHCLILFPHHPWAWLSSALAGEKAKSQKVHLPEASVLKGFPGGSVVKNPQMIQETPLWSQGLEDPLENEMQPTPAFLPEKAHGQEPGNIQSTGSQDQSQTQATKRTWLVLGR